MLQVGGVGGCGAGSPALGDVVPGRLHGRRAARSCRGRAPRRAAAAAAAEAPLGGAALRLPERPATVNACSTQPAGRPGQAGGGLPHRAVGHPTRAAGGEAQKQVSRCMMQPLAGPGLAATQAGASRQAGPAGTRPAAGAARVTPLPGSALRGGGQKMFTSRPDITAGLLGARRAGSGRQDGAGPAEAGRLRGLGEEADMWVHVVGSRWLGGGRAGSRDAGMEGLRWGSAGFARFMHGGGRLGWAGVGVTFGQQSLPGDSGCG